MNISYRRSVQARFASLLDDDQIATLTGINALLGEQRMVTAEVSDRDGRGTHTTSHRQLVRLPGGGLLLQGRRRFVDVAHQQGNGRRVVEGRTTSQHLIEDDPYRIQVSPRVDRFDGMPARPRARRPERRATSVA